jgi:type IV pilus assembly protein PilM
MAINVVGLDIGSTAVRGVEIKAGKKGKLNLLQYHEVALPHGAVRRGEVLESEIVSSALKRLWFEGKFKSKNVVLGTGNQRISVRDLSLPKMSLKHIRESLPYHVQNMLQTPLEDLLLDFYPVSESSGDQGTTINGLLIAAEKTEILGNIRASELAGLTPVEVDLIPFALNRLLVQRPHLAGTIALVAIGGNTTSVIITHNGVPLFVRIIPAGGDDLTQGLMSSLEITYEEAEKLKRVLRYNPSSGNENESNLMTPPCACPKCMAVFASANDSRTIETLQSVMGELLSSLRSTVNYFNNTRPVEPVIQVLLSGGGAQLSGLAKSLAEITHTPVNIADPFESMTISRQLKNHRPQDSDASFAVALALALRSQK